VAVDAQSNVYVTGKGAGEEATNCLTIKYDSSGQEIWVARYQDASQGNSIVLDDCGNAYVAGSVSAADRMVIVC